MKPNALLEGRAGELDSQAMTLVAERVVAHSPSGRDRRDEEDEGEGTTSTSAATVATTPTTAS